MGVDVNQGASQIAQLLQPEQPEVNPEPSNSEPVEESQDIPQEEQEEEYQPSGPEVEGDDAETPEHGDTEAEEPKFKVSVGGEEKEVTAEELRKGYMMEADYRKKTSEVARKRDELKAKEDALAAKIADAEIMLSIETEDLDSDENKELKSYDPSAFYEKKEAVEAKKRRLESLKAEMSRSLAERKQETIQKEKELIFQAVPEWLDQKVLTDEAALVNKLWSDAGFTEQELDSFTDHRLVAISRKAALYDKLMAAKPEAKKVQSKPKSMKAGTPKTPEQASKDKNKDVLARARSTGRMQDAAKAIKSLMG